jgi:hypothetical protein
MSTLSTDLRKAAADFRKQAEEARTAHTIKCAQVLAGAKGLLGLQEILNKQAAGPVPNPNNEQTLEAINRIENSQPGATSYDF